MKRVRMLTLIFMLTGCLLRLTHWSAPLTSDEGFMLRFYANSSYSYITSTYIAANNHVLLTLILHAIDAYWPRKLILSFASHWPLQIPSLLAAMAGLWFLGGIAAALAGPVAAQFAVVALALSYWHLIYSHMLRGYSLSTALVLGALWLSITALRRGQAWRLAVAAVVCACANYVVPTNVMFTAALAASLPWLKGPRPRPVESKGKARAPARQSLSWAWLTAAGVICAILTLGAYWPMLDQLRHASASSAVGWGEAFAQTPARLRAALDVLGCSGPWVWSFALAALLGLAAAFRGGRRARAAAGVATSYLIVPVALFSLQRVLPMPRIYLPAVVSRALCRVDCRII